MTNTTQELKACAHCGVAAKHSETSRGHNIFCSNSECGTKMLYFRTKKYAFEAWNTRADRTQAIDDCINVVENERTDDDRSVVCNQIIEKLEALKE